MRLQAPGTSKKRCLQRALGDRSAVTGGPVEEKAGAREAGRIGGGSSCHHSLYAQSPRGVDFWGGGGG